MSGRKAERRERESRERLGLVELRPWKEVWLKYKSRRESGDGSSEREEWRPVRGYCKRQ